jgi:hypothetical protein
MRRLEAIGDCHPLLRYAVECELADGVPSPAPRALPPQFSGRPHEYLKQLNFGRLPYTGRGTKEDDEDEAKEAPAQKGKARGKEAAKKKGSKAVKLPKGARCALLKAPCGKGPQPQPACAARSCPGCFLGHMPRGSSG